MKTIALTLSFLLLACVAFASRPVPVKITGCVKHGVLFSEQTDFGNHVSAGGYRIRVTDGRGDVVNLSRYEGRRIKVAGTLLPGDTFILTPGMIRVLGECRRAQPKRPMDALRLR